MSLDLVLTNGQVFIDGDFRSCCIGVKDGKIAAICEERCAPEAREVIDLKGQYVIPGAIDTHTHFRDPGMTDREDFFTGTMTAAAGGTTTVMEHPISSPSAYSCEVLDNRVRVADPQACVDFAFYGAAGTQVPGGIASIADHGIVGYKSFLHDPPAGRGDDFKNATMCNDADMMTGFAEVAKTGHVLMLHCENNEMITANIKRMREEGHTKPIDHCRSRPPFTEIECVQKVLSMAKETGLRAGFAHISTPEAMELVKTAKNNGQDVYLETCTHYLFLDETYLEKFGAIAKCNPPLRPRETVESLWKYANDGSIDFIGSDHGGFTLAEKAKGKEDIFSAPSGFVGIDLRLPMMLDAVAKGRISIRRVVEMLCSNPAKIFGLVQKGSIRVGADADLVVYNMDEKTVYDMNKCYSKSKDLMVMYDGLELSCKLAYTFVRGRKVMENGVVDPACRGWGHHIAQTKRGEAVK